MRSKIIFFSLALSLVLLITWVGKEVVVKQRGTRSDFFAIWYGSNATLNRISPYSIEVTQTIHANISGRILKPGVYPHSFAYPAYLAVVLLPFALLPYSTSFVLWTGIQLPMLFIALYLLAKFIGLKLNTVGWVILFVGGSIGFLYPLFSYALGQTSIFLLFLVVLVFFFLGQRKLIEAGILLAIISIRPDIFALTGLASLIILWKSQIDIKPLILTTLAGFLLINIISVFLLGFWYADWANMLVTYSGANPKTHWPLDILPNTGTRFALIVFSLVYLVWQGVQFLRTPTKSKKLLMISALIVIYFLLSKVTGSYQMTLLLIPALVLLYLYARLKLRWMIWIILFMPLGYWAIGGTRLAWSDQLLIPLSLLVLQVAFVLADLSHFRMSKNVSPHEITE